MLTTAPAQWMFEGSDEAPDCPGLGLLAGRCFRRGGVDPARLEIDLVRQAPIVDHVPPTAVAYFAHGQVAGVQFHPDKSGKVGAAILRNFVALAG